MTNEHTEYDSISAAAQALDIKQSRISMYFNNNQKKTVSRSIYFSKNC